MYTKNLQIPAAGFLIGWLPQIICPTICKYNKKLYLPQQTILVRIDNISEEIIFNIWYTPSVTRVACGNSNILALKYTKTNKKERKNK